MDEGKSIGTRPLSPSIQIYRPELTSVLSIGYRISGIVLSVYLVGMVVWLLAGAAGPHAYSTMRMVLSSWIGQTILFAGTFALFWHLYGGIRHLVWDTVHGFELRSIYMSGWAVVGASALSTLVAWGISLFLKG